jgi:hypothetical protein
MIRGVCEDNGDLKYLPRIPLYDRDTYPRFLIEIALAGVSMIKQLAPTLKMALEAKAD